MSAQPEPAPASAITGYVELLTGARVLGWAWAPDQPGRAVIAELLSGETVLATATADQEREDLRNNGIGDGRHAFALDVPEAARGLPLRVVARLDDAAPVPLPMPPSSAADARALERIERALNALANSQRLLHRNLQAVMMEQREHRALLSPDDTVAMETSLRALDAAAIRIEERLALIDPPPPPPRARGLWLAGIGMLAVSCAASSAMLWHVLAAP